MRKTKGRVTRAWGNYRTEDRFYVSKSWGYPSAAESTWMEIEYAVCDKYGVDGPVAWYVAGGQARSPDKQSTTLRYRARQAHQRAIAVCRELNKKERGERYDERIFRYRVQYFPGRGAPKKGVRH